MTFPNDTCRMIAQISDLGDLPDDLEIFYDDGCFYFRIGLAESEDGLWFTSIDIGYVESTGRSPCSQVKPIDFAMFGFEITVTDQKDNISYTTMDPLEARWCIPEEMRPLVVAIACEGFAYSNLNTYLGSHGCRPLAKMP